MSWEILFHSQVHGHPHHAQFYSLTQFLSSPCRDVVICKLGTCQESRSPSLRNKQFTLVKMFLTVQTMRCGHTLISYHSWYTGLILWKIPLHRCLIEGTCNTLHLFSINLATIQSPDMMIRSFLNNTQAIVLGETNSIKTLWNHQKADCLLCMGSWIHFWELMTCSEEAIFDAGQWVSQLGILKPTKGKKCPPRVWVRLSRSRRYRRTWEYLVSDH